MAEQSLCKRKVGGSTPLSGSRFSQQKGVAADFSSAGYQRVLEDWYIRERRSSAFIARQFGCSSSKVNYWLKRYSIPKRTISDALYVLRNPDGDPFAYRHPRTLSDAVLFGVGMGLYWGEGTKASKNSVRLGNTNPELLRTFIQFLIRFFSIDAADLRFHLQIFTDISLRKAVRYWQKEIGFARNQLYKPLVTRSGSLGTYRNKSVYGVLTVYYGNTRLRNAIVDLVNHWQDRFEKPL